MSGKKKTDWEINSSISSELNYRHQRVFNICLYADEEQRILNLAQQIIAALPERIKGEMINFCFLLHEKKWCIKEARVMPLTRGWCHVLRTRLENKVVQLDYSFNVFLCLRIWSRARSGLWGWDPERVLRFSNSIRLTHWSERGGTPHWRIRRVVGRIDIQSVL